MITVPDVIVMLRGLDIISDRAARKKLALIEPITAKALIVGSLHALDTRKRLP